MFITRSFTQISHTVLKCLISYLWQTRNKRKLLLIYILKILKVFAYICTFCYHTSHIILYLAAKLSLRRHKFHMSAILLLPILRNWDTTLDFPPVDNLHTWLQSFYIWCMRTCTKLQSTLHAFIFCTSSESPNDKREILCNVAFVDRLPSVSVLDARRCVHSYYPSCMHFIRLENTAWQQRNFVQLRFFFFNIRKFYNIAQIQTGFVSRITEWDIIRKSLGWFPAQTICYLPRIMPSSDAEKKWN
jgi:hypothetical protein